MRNTDIKNIFRNSNTLIYVAMSILGRERNSVIPELLYTIDRDHLLKLVTIFGGEKIYIPTPEEFKFSMDCAMAAYYFKSQGQRWYWIQNAMKLTDEELEAVKEKVLDWAKNASREELNILVDFKEPTGIL